ncbi:MAG: PA14 domain-containing protein [Luteolibacter sp.]
MISARHSLLAASVALALIPAVSRAEYFGFNVDDNSDIVYLETRYPFWPESTYNARFSSHVIGEKKDGPSTYFYSGPTFGSTDKAEALNGYIWSFWPVDRAITAGDAVKPVFWAGDYQSPLSIGEGASGKIEGKVPMKTQAWYGGLIRVWKPTDENGENARIGQWFRDGVTGQWKHLATMRVPFAATGLKGSGGFVEDFSHGNRNPRRVEFRNAYHHVNGAWKPSDTFTCSTRQATEKGDSGLIENNTAAFFETCSGESYKGTMGPGAVEKNWKLATPASPAFDAFKVTDVTAHSVGGQVVVDWKVPDTSAPQFAWKVEVFGSKEAMTSGTPLATGEARDPDARMALVNAPGLKHGDKIAVRLTLTDIFDRPASPVLVAAPGPQEILTPPAAVKTIGGLDYAWFELPANTKEMPDLSKLKPAWTGAVNDLDLTISHRHENYACRYSGSLVIPTGGLWMFHLRSSDGSKLILDNKTAVDFDGYHSNGGTAGGWVALKAGTHNVEVQYFKGTRASNDNIDLLELRWQGPGTPLAKVPESAWARKPDGADPQVRLIDPKPGQLKPSSNAADTKLVAVVSNKQAGEMQFFSGSTLWARAAGGTETRTLLGSGPNHLRARLVYDGNKSVDSPAVDVDVAQPALTPWTFSPVGTRAFPAAAGVADGTFSVVSDGFNFIWQQLEGDRALIAHTAAKPDPGSGSQGDGSKYGSDWKGGLVFRDNLNANTSNPPGDHFVALYAQVDGTIHLQADTDANGGGPVSGPDLNHGNYTWLKLQRTGNTFTAYGSTDGKAWTEIGKRENAKVPAKAYTGLFTLARPSPNPNPHWWKFDGVTIDSK